MAANPPRFYFSFRSPYSWLAYRDLMSQYRDIAARVDWIPFWEPDERSRRMLAEAGGSFAYVDMSRAKSFYVLQDVRRLATRRHLTLTWPVDRKPWWEVAHLAYLVAQAHGVGPPFIARVYRARWEEGRNISDRDTITAIGAEVGVPAGELHDTVDDPAVRAAGLAALLSIHADGVFGVPFFTHGRDRYWGIDRLAEFATALRGDGTDTGAGFVASTVSGPDEAWTERWPAADQGHAGGCG